jgi:hypothetical protein
MALTRICAAMIDPELPRSGTTSRAARYSNMIVHETNARKKRLASVRALFVTTQARSTVATWCWQRDGRTHWRRRGEVRGKGGDRAQRPGP